MVGLGHVQDLGQARPDAGGLSMANKLKGEVPFEACGEPFVLVMDFNAICSIDTELGIGIEEIGNRLAGSAPTIRSVFRIGLAAKHGELTDLEAGRLIGDIGPSRAAELLAEALTAAFPEAAKAPENPPKPATRAPGTSRKR